MKGYTDLEQSKKLAEILPLESADICYVCGNTTLVSPTKYGDTSIEKLYKKHIIPCWSLAALFEQLKAEIQLEKNKQILFLHINKYDDINYDIRYTNSWTGEVLIAEADNLIDACVAIIEKMNELNLL